MLHTTPQVTIPVIASAYCDSKNRTATGTRVHPGTIAVDPNIIPLRSRVRIFIRHTGDWIGRFVHLQSQHINYKAEDTGGMIKGARIDLWKPSCSDAVSWGMRRVDVVIGYAPYIIPKSIIHQPIKTLLTAQQTNKEISDISYWLKEDR